MHITRSGTHPSGKGPAAWFTGNVRIDPLFSPPEPARVAGALVTFEPGARTAWHTHPLGQTLIVTVGLGLVQREGGAVEEIRPGDVVWFPPGERHWHGAGPETAMSHIAVQEKLNGSPVDWMEHGPVQMPQIECVPRPLLERLHIRKPAVARALPDQRPVHPDLEDPPGSGNQRHRSQLLAESGQKFLRHPSRAQQPVAPRAIGNRDVRPQCPASAFAPSLPVGVRQRAPPENRRPSARASLGSAQAPGTRVHAPPPAP